MRLFKLVITPFLLSAAMCLSAEEGKSEKPQPRSTASTSSYRDQRGFDLAVFQFGGGFMLNKQDHVRGLGAMAWAPSYHFNGTISARWNVGFVFRNAFAKDELRVGDFSLTFVEKPKFNSPLFGEIGGGVQYWTGDSSRKFYPTAKAGFGYQFGDGKGFFKSVQLNYVYVIHSPLKTQQLLGVFTIGF
ncbi:MAG: hypothetical protein EBQ92_06335 [Proteobacteria bacterium]|jgi:hypothetical protein|nr:hypothetical protein [Pseudomonadota bacterium]